MCIWGGSNDDDNDNGDVLSVGGSVHTVWRENLGFNDKLLFPCSMKAFSSIAYGFEWDNSDVSKSVVRSIKVFFYNRFFVLIVSDVCEMLSKRFRRIRLVYPMY